jgi:putative membrane protein
MSCVALFRPGSARRARNTLRRTALTLPLLPAMALAHGEPLQPHDLWRSWTLDAGSAIPLTLSAILYLKGARSSRGALPGRQCCFWAGWTILTLALVSPLHALGEVLFSAHMVQHELLMLAAAPLLVLSRPLPALLWGLPIGWRRTAGVWSKRKVAQNAWRRLTDPFTAWSAHAVVLWAWHAPPLFQATIGNDWIHAEQHASFFISALLFWWALLYAPGRSHYGIGVLYIFTTSIHTGILGALLTFAPSLWYPVYAGSAPLWGLTALQDQQIGGLIMWVPAGLVYLGFGLSLFAAWLRQSEVRATALLGCIALFILLPLGSSCGSDRRRAAAAVTGGDPRRGVAAISRYGCGSCHTISGIPIAHGLVGPPLTGIGTRLYVAGVLPNTPENIVHWIQDPKGVNEKTAMPVLGVTPQDAADIAAYLYTTR